MTSPVIGTPWKKLNAPVSEEALEGVDKYWRVANYRTVWWATGALPLA